MGVKPLYFPPIKPSPGQIYLEWFAKEHARNIERAFLGMPIDHRPYPYQVKMAMPDGQDDVVLGEVKDGQESNLG